MTIFRLEESRELLAREEGQFLECDTMGNGAPGHPRDAPKHTHPAVPAVQRSGFTLAEMLGLMLIMAILLAVAVVVIRGLGKGPGLHGTAQQLKSALSLARQYAITHGQSVYVLFPTYQNDVPASGDTSRCRGYRAYALCTISNDSPVYLSEWQHLPPRMIIQTNSDIFADASFSTNMPANGLGLSNPSNLPVVVFKTDGSVQSGNVLAYIQIFIGQGAINNSGYPVLCGRGRGKVVRLEVQTGTLRVD